MERLTYRKQGDINVFCPSNVPCYTSCDNCEHMDKMLKKLADYEDAEEQGLLLRLPCKVGSAVYLICSSYTKCTENDQEFNEYSCQGCECLECDSHREYYIHKNDSVFLEWIIRKFEEFGKTVFLTREEAEQTLKQMGE